jgi:hypothetical protein
MTAMADHLGSAYAAGFISGLVLVLGSVTRFGAGLHGTWHVVYVVTAGAALYFNVLLGAVGTFSQTELSLLVVQCAVVLPFVGVTVAVLKRFCYGALAERHWPTSGKAASRDAGDRVWRRQYRNARSSESISSTGGGRDS